MKHLKVLRSTLQVLCSILVLSVILCLPRSVFAANGVNKIINFQGKVTNANGTNVTDGAYDFVIKIYDGAGSGASTLFTETWSNAALWSSTMSSAPSSGGESLTYSTGTNESTIKVGQILWNATKKESVIITSVDTGANTVGISPTRQAWNTTDTVTNRIYVKDGVFKVAINSLNVNISGVNFGTDNIFMGVEFNGDGEMKPRIQYTATPYAMNAEKVNGLTVTNTSDTAFGSTTILKIGDGKTVQIDNGLRFTGTDGTQFTFPSATGTVVTADSAATLTNKIIGSGGLVFTGADSDISTTSNQHFSILPNGTGNVGVGTTTPDALLRVLGSVGTVPTASFSANSSSATFITDNQLGDLFTASASGLSRFTITNGGGIMLGTSVGTSSQCLLGGATASWGSCGGGTNYWQQALGAVAPAEITNDLLVGGSATSSALHRFVGTIGTTDSYNKISGRATGQALLQIDETGNQDILTASKGGTPKFSITHAGNIQLFSAGSAAIGNNNTIYGSTVANGRLFLDSTTNGTKGGIYFFSTSNSITSSGDLSLAGSGEFGPLGGGAGYIGINTLANSLARIRLGGDSTIDTFSNGGRTALTLANLGAGSYVDVTIDDGTLSVNGRRTGQALVQFSEEGDSDIFTASSSGVARFVIKNDGNVGISTTIPTAKFQVLGDASTTPTASISARSSFAGLAVDNTVGDLFTASASGLNRFALTNSGGIKLGTDEGDSGECLKSGGAGAAVTWGSCGTGGSLFTADGGGVFTYLTSTTQDLLIGGSTAAAGAFYFDITNGSSSILSIGTDGSKNGVINLYSATTGKTASISNDASGNLTLAAGTGGSVIVGSGTGDINIEPGADDAIVNLASTGDFLIQDNGATFAIFNDTGAVGIGTTAPRGRLEVVGLNGTTSTASVSAASSFAGLVVDNSVGDIFTASSSGTTRMVIDNTGDLGIGTTAPTARLDVKSGVNFTAISGTYSVTNGSPTVTRSSGSFSLIENFMPGDIVSIGGQTYTILSISLSSTMTLTENYAGSTNASETIYSDQNFMQLMNASGTTRLSVNYSGKLFLPDGRPANPSIAFINSPKTGLYSQSTDNITFVAGSQNIISANLVSGAGRLMIGNGTAPVSRLQINSDENTNISGITFGGSASTYLQLYKSGSNMLTLTGGSFGVGTTSPLAKLHIDGGNDPVASISARSAFAGLVVDNTVGDIFTASSSGLTRLVVKNNGSVGIGLSNPEAAKFTISDSSLAPGVDMAFISATTGITTTGVDGLQIDIANAGSGAITNAGLTINVTSNNTNASSFLYGLNVGNLTSGGESADETALHIGTGWDKGLVIESGGSTNSGLVYSGSGRPTKTITLSPEYPGATLTDFYGANTDANVTGDVTSDIETTGSNNQRTYYQWERTTDATQHFATVAVRVKLPKDFSAWAESNAVVVNYVTESATNTVSDLDVRVYLESDSDLSTTDGESLNNASTSWTTVSIDDSTLNEWNAADEGGVIYLRMGSASSNHVRIGDIQLNYLAAF